MERAAALISQADGMVVTAGAGIGVDSGLPDFRGNHGFWQAYPALSRARIEFTTIACPDAFREDPEVAWGFYGHRLQLYRATAPHMGFKRLLDLAARVQHGAFVFTSNVDGQFQKAGFAADRIVEVHGSIHHLQCMDGCFDSIWSADGLQPAIDEGACRMLSALPRCPHCDDLARPNILMFGDGGWIEDRSAEQHRRFDAWFREVRRPVVIEVGAGTHIPTVRQFGERYAASLIRINPTDAEILGDVGVSIPLGGRQGVEQVFQAVTASSGT